MDPINIQINYVPSRQLIDISTTEEGVINFTKTNCYANKNDWPLVIDEICDHLRNFLKEMKIENE